MIFLGIGASLGDKEAHFALAERLLTLSGVKIIKKSQNHTTKPFGGVAENDFLNAVWQVETSFTPLGLLALCQRVERICGRQKKAKWDDRTLDIDLLAYHQQKVNTSKLKVPHPEAHKRDFVMIPWQEIISEEEIKKYT